MFLNRRQQLPTEFGTPSQSTASVVFTAADHCRIGGPDCTILLAEKAKSEVQTNSSLHGPIDRFGLGESFSRPPRVSHGSFAI